MRFPHIPSHIESAPGAPPDPTAGRRDSRTRRIAGATVTAAVAVAAVATLSGPAGASALAGILLTGDPLPAAAGPATALTGALPDGATWLIEKPANWNGTLVLYGHGMVAPGEDNPAKDAPDPITGKFLLDQGYAIAGSSYATTGFALEPAMDDQADLVGIFRDEVGTPTTTIVWGTSLGGMVTAGLLERHPELFDGGLAMCGPLAGGVGLMDSYLDTLFALKTLLAPNVSLVHLGDSLFDEIGALQAAVEAAQTTAQGRARIALAAAIGDFPGWAHADNPRPATDDYATQQQAQFEHMMEMAFFGLALGADIDGKFGGNPATNIGVDYATVLRHSNSGDEVPALYEQAGLSLKNDLRTLKTADRIAADPAARARLAQVSNFTGRIADPMLTLHTAGDNQVVVEHENAYARTVRRAGNGGLLRQAFTERAVHCAFTPAEMLSALGTLTDRVGTGTWKHSADAGSLQARAIALGPDLNVHIEDDPTQPIPTEPHFTELDPSRFPRPFDRK
jgi:pimeloyl-ACP methyl ester carboxylesterase